MKDKTLKHDIDQVQLVMVRKKKYIDTSSIFTWCHEGGWINVSVCTLVGYDSSSLFIHFVRIFHKDNNSAAIVIIIFLCRLKLLPCLRNTIMT